MSLRITWGLPLAHLYRLPNALWMPSWGRRRYPSPSACDEDEQDEAHEDEEHHPGDSGEGVQSGHYLLLVVLGGAEEPEHQGCCYQDDEQGHSLMVVNVVDGVFVAVVELVSVFGGGVVPSRVR